MARPVVNSKRVAVVEGQHVDKEEDQTFNWLSMVGEITKRVWEGKYGLVFNTLCYPDCCALPLHTQSISLGANLAYKCFQC